MKEDFTRRKVTVAGIQESGKTVFIRACAKKFKCPAVFSPNRHDWVDENVLLWVASPSAYKNELLKFLSWVKENNKRAFRGEKGNDDKRLKPIDAIFMDDVDLAFESTGSNSTTGIINDLHVLHRHKPWYLACFFITRRPQDIPTKLVESSHFNIIYSIEGDNVFKKYNNVDKKILPLLENEIPYESYKYIVKPIGKAPYVNSPVPLKK
jgi:hypothetical protein